MERGGQLVGLVGVAGPGDALGRGGDLAALGARGRARGLLARRALLALGAAAAQERGGRSPAPSPSASEAKSVAAGRSPRSRSVVGASAGSSSERRRARRLRTVVLRSPDVGRGLLARLVEERGLRPGRTRGLRGVRGGVDDGLGAARLDAGVVLVGEAAEPLARAGHGVGDGEAAHHHACEHHAREHHVADHLPHEAEQAVGDGAAPRSRPRARPRPARRPRPGSPPPRRG